MIAGEEALVAAAALAKGNSAPVVVKEPVVGSRRKLRYTTIIERDGVEIEAEVTEEDGWEVGTWGAALGFLAATVVALSAIGAASEAAARRAAQQDAHPAERVPGGDIKQAAPLGPNER